MNNESVPLKTPFETPNGKIKRLAIGNDSKIETPFVYVARTKETYAEMQKLVGNLPSAEEIDFNKSAVVAAFAGQKNTGGYTVRIDGTDGNFSVKLNSPPPNAFVTQALTKPYLVSLVPVGEEESLNLDISEDWMKKAEIYKVMSGEIEFSGGFVGKQQKFEPQGTIRVLQSGEYVSLIFDLEGKENAGDKKANDIASGLLKDGKVNLPRLEATNLIDRPHLPFIVSGTISNGKMSLKFEKGTRSYVLNDGFEGSGKLEAVKGS